MEFLPNLNEKPLPPHKRKVPLLTTFWRLFLFSPGFSLVAFVGKTRGKDKTSLRLQTFSGAKC